MNNDLISREALKKCLEEDKACGGTKIQEFDKGYDLGIQTAIEFVDNAPTLEPEITEKQAILLLINNGWLVNHDKELREKWERPHGKWIITSEDTEGIHHIKCPFCKYEKGSEFEPYIKVTFDKLPDFCEKCGADMRKEKRDEQTAD